jgi:hypothetical protein
MRFILRCTDPWISRYEIYSVLLRVHMVVKGVEVICKYCSRIFIYDWNFYFQHIILITWVPFNFLTQKLFILQTVCYYILWWHKKESNHILDHLVLLLANFIAAQLNKKLSALYKPKGPLLFINAYHWIHILSHLHQIHTPHFYKLVQTG